MASTLPSPGLIVLFGSGETSANGQKVFDWLLRQAPAPVRVAILETPAGFELNSDRVAGRIADFLRQRLQNYEPRVAVLPARKRDAPFGTESPEVVAPLLESNVIFLGPGSPTYAVRQLHDSLAWHALLARHRTGAAVALASAATIAASRYALPVYEIYKVGEDLHWRAGLDFLGSYGLPLVFIPHWNNNDGGSELDTSRCFMGQERFERLLELLPAPATIVGIDEHSALALDLAAGVCRVLGRGGVTVLRAGRSQTFAHGKGFALGELGPFRPLADAAADIPPQVWQQATASLAESAATDGAGATAEVLALLAEREDARSRRDWARADALRDQLTALGWQIQDTPEGPQLIR